MKKKAFYTLHNIMSDFFKLFTNQLFTKIKKKYINNI